MASLNFFVPPTINANIATTSNSQRRLSVRTAATAAKGGKSAAAEEEKSLLDFILGSLTKQDQFYETDPILKKVEDQKPTTGTTSRGKSTVVIPPKKKEGGTGFNIGGLFVKKD